MPTRLTFTQLPRLVLVLALAGIVGFGTVPVGHAGSPHFGHHHEPFTLEALHAQAPQHFEAASAVHDSSCVACFSRHRDGELVVAAALPSRGAVPVARVRPAEHVASVRDGVRPDRPRGPPPA